MADPTDNGTALLGEDALLDLLDHLPRFFLSSGNVSTHDVLSGLLGSPVKGEGISGPADRERPKYPRTREDVAHPHEFLPQLIAGCGAGQNPGEALMMISSSRGLVQKHPGHLGRRTSFAL